jgi:hypothetical protein
LPPPHAAGKEGLRENYFANKVDAFNGKDAPWGHGPTNTSKWVRLSKPITYRVKYEPRYEPFLVMARRLAPWCDERFVGYGGNKIAYINQLQGLGFTFHVHPYGFAIHVPHTRTKAANLFVQEKRRGESDMDDLRARVEREIHEGGYKPQTVFCGGSSKPLAGSIRVGVEPRQQAQAARPRPAGGLQEEDEEEPRRQGGADTEERR